MWGLPLTWSDLTSTHKIELIAGHITQILKNKPGKVFIVLNITTAVASNQLRPRHSLTSYRDYFLFKPIYPKTCTIFDVHTP